MIESLEDLRLHIHQALGEKVRDSRLRLGELTIDMEREGLPDACRWLRDDPACAFEQLVDLCGMDYLEYGDGTWQGPRFAVVYHLLSVTRNHRLRVRVFLDDDIPIVPSVTEVWNCADWFEREAFDLFGMVFEGHPDLRRILTDYGFVGHPFRKDFPLVGLVEMRYDPDKKRVVYEPTRTEERDLVPRVIREDEESHYHGRNQ